ncbi:hypothetical protein SAMN05660816_04398 [Niastella yeongjuensis]|nr:hypothetical protein SAMN05660816_04398 [Niastella yeongjuensis]
MLNYNTASRLSYFESLQSINNSFNTRDRTSVKLTIVSEDLEDEDLMIMLNASIINNSS